MNVTLRSQDLLRELQLLEKIVSKKPTIPVLAYLLVQADETGLRLAATDLEIGLVTFCPAQVAIPGTVTLPVKHLSDILATFPDMDITLVKEQNVVRLTAGKYTSRLQTYPAADFPVLPSMKDLPTLSLPCAALRDAVQRTRFAITEKSKSKQYTLDGALASFMADGFTLVATDTHRLAFMQHVGPIGECAPVIFPTSVLDALMTTLTGTDVVLFASGERHLFFVVDGRMLFSRTLDGKFPNYDRIIPKGNDKTITLNRTALKAAVGRVALTAVEIRFQLSPGLLEITTKSAEMGDAAEDLHTTYDGAPATILLSGAYLLDFLGATDVVEVTMSWKTAAGPLLFEDGSGYRYVQMPVRA